MSVRLERWSREELIARIRVLEAELVASQLSNAFRAPDVAAAGLTPRQRDAVAALLGRGWVDSAEVARHLYGPATRIRSGDRNDSRHSARILMGRASRRLGRIGWRVNFMRLHGFRLERTGESLGVGDAAA